MHISSEYSLEMLQTLWTSSENTIIPIIDTTQLPFTCSKSTIETLDEDVKYVRRL